MLIEDDASFDVPLILQLVDDNFDTVLRSFRVPSERIIDDFLDPQLGHLVVSFHIFCIPGSMIFSLELGDLGEREVRL